MVKELQINETETSEATTSRCSSKLVFLKIS